MSTTTRVTSRKRPKPPTLSVTVAGALFDMSKNTAYAAVREHGGKQLVEGVPVIAARSLRVPTSAVEAKLGIDIAEYFDLIDEIEQAEREASAAARKRKAERASPTQVRPRGARRVAAGS